MEKILGATSKAGVNGDLILFDHESIFSSAGLKARGRIQLFTRLQNMYDKGFASPVIVSTLCRRDLDQIKYPGYCTLIAEHGALIKRGGNVTWEKLLDEDNDWKLSLIPFLYSLKQKYPSTGIEEREQSLYWTQRSILRGRFPYRAEQDLEPYLRKFNLRLVNGKNYFELLPNTISKARAVCMLSFEYPERRIIAIGAQGAEDLFCGVHVSRYGTVINLGSTSEVQRKIEKVIDSIERSLLLEKEEMELC